MPDRPRLDSTTLGCSRDEPAVRPDCDSVDRPIRLRAICILERILMHSLGCIYDGQAGLKPTGRVLTVTGHEQSVPVGEERNPAR